MLISDKRVSAYLCEFVTNIGAPVAQWVKRWSVETSGLEFELCSRRNLLNRKRDFIAHQPPIVLI